MKEPWEWGEVDVLHLISDQVQESLTLDYKECDALQKTESKKTEISVVGFKGRQCDLRSQHPSKHSRTSYGIRQTLLQAFQFRNDAHGRVRSAGCISTLDRSRSLYRLTSTREGTFKSMREGTSNAGFFRGTLGGFSRRGYRLQ